MATLMALAGAMSCQKELTNDFIRENEGETVALTVSLQGETLITKATGIKEANEKKVKKMQVYVLDSSGAVESYKSATGESLTLSTTTGSKEIYALVNCPDYPAIASKTELLNTVSQFSANALDGFEMVGVLKKTITSTDPTEVVPVKRLVSKVVIGKISARFTSAAYSSLPFTVKAIYLINVAGDMNYGVDGTPSVWYNKSKYESSACDFMLYDGNLNRTVTSTTPYTVEHSFYCYPNPTSGDANGGTWSARHTRLVIETTLGQETYYYPITLPAIDRNKTYCVSELIVTRPGSTDPDVPVSTSSCTYSVQVEGWNAGLAPYVETI